MDKDFNREFDQCPNCGSTDRFLEQLGNEIKERGLAREEWGMYMDVKEGVVIDQTKDASIPIGSTLPVFQFKTDICMDCGSIYAVAISRAEAKKPPPSPAAPNRAQRRRIEKEGGPPLSNPLN